MHLDVGNEQMPGIVEFGLVPESHFDGQKRSLSRQILLKGQVSITLKSPRYQDNQL